MVGKVLGLLASLAMTTSACADALEHWTYRNLNGMPSAVTFGGGQFVAVGSVAGSSYITTSPDGIVWTTQGLVGMGSLNAVCFGDGKFVALSSFGGVVVSSNGHDWVSSLLPNNASLAVHSITHGGGRFVAVGYRVINPASYDYRATIYTSTDTANWTEWMSETNARLEAVAYGNGRFVAVGGGFNTSTNHRVFTSTNGLDWMAHASSHHQLRGITFGSGQFVASPGNAEMLTSTDGVTWAAHPYAAPQAFISNISYGNGSFIAVGSRNQSQHTILRSDNGTNWQVQYIGPTNGNWFLHGAAYGAGRFVVVGMPQLAAYSEDVVTPYLRVVSPGDPLQLRVSGKMGRTYRLQSSTNLPSWNDVVQYTNQAASTLFDLPTTQETSARFFRAISP